MKATCPSCASTYKVADEKIPEVGAQIKCPKCNTLFVVRRPPPASVPPDPTPPPDAAPSGPTHEQSTSLGDLLGDPTSSLPPRPPRPSGGEYSVKKSEKTVPAQTDSQPAPQPPPPRSVPQSPTPYLDGLQGKAEVSGKPAGVPEYDSAGAPLHTDPRARSKGVSAIRAQSTVRPAAPKAGPLGYRVRTARGLSYDFSDRESMMRWLGDRESVEGCEVAEPGKDWVPVSMYLPQGPSTGSVPVVLDQDETYQPEPGEPVPGMEVPEEEPARTGGVLPVALWAAAGLSVLVLVYALSATLTRYGVLNLSSVLPVSWVGVQFPGEEAAAGSQEPPAEVTPRDPEKAYRKAIGLARRSMRAKRFSRAALEYQRALTFRPDSAAALRGLARAYNGLGDRERALAAMKKAKARANQEPGEGSPAPKEKG